MSRFEGGPRPDMPEMASRKEAAESKELSGREFVELLDTVRARLEYEIGFAQDPNVEKKRDALLAKYPELAREFLNLKPQIAEQINVMFHTNLITQGEAETLLAALNESRGRDNYTTLAIMEILGRLDLFQREKILEKDFRGKPKRKP